MDAQERVKDFDQLNIYVQFGSDRDSRIRSMFGSFYPKIGERVIVDGREYTVDRVVWRQEDPLVEGLGRSVTAVILPSTD